MQLLFELAESAVAKWREMGLALHFSNDELDEIHLCAGGPRSCFIELLSRWLQRAPPKHLLPTVEILCEALRSSLVGRERTAYDIEQHFIEKGKLHVHIAC